MPDLSSSYTITTTKQNSEEKILKLWVISFNIIFVSWTAIFSKTFYNVDTNPMVRLDFTNITSEFPWILNSRAFVCLFEWYSCFSARRLKQICLYYLHYLHKKMAEGFFFPLSKDLSLLRHLLEQLSPESLSYLCKGSSYICTKYYIQKILSNVKFPQTLEELLYYCVLMNYINILIWMIGPSLSKCTNYCATFLIPSAKSFNH